MPLIALTGGIASGKSTIAARLAEHGAVIVDADQIVRDVQGPGSPVLAAIAAEFGEDVIRADGALDRAALGARVFADQDRLQALNAIVHPAVREESARRFTAALDTDPAAVVVYDVPLLVEARVDDPWDLIVVA
jgi:dephospho-CoA kinase